MTIIEKIKAEIERLKTVQLKRIQEGDLVDAEPYDKIEAYNELLDFLYTLEPEKPMQEELEREIAEMYQALFGTDVINRKEMIYLDTFEAIARHFAQWQYQKDRGKFAQIKAKTWSEGFDACKEQMMKDAVEYEVWDFSSSLEAYPHVNIPLDNKQYRSGDKVRVIVLPKED